MEPSDIAPGDDIVFNGVHLGLVTVAAFYDKSGKNKLYDVPAKVAGKGTEVHASRKVDDKLAAQHVLAKLVTSEGDEIPAPKTITFVDA
ncbi:hypothetical protein [Streptomyces sp. CBMA156]|uniref:hypothetical protein n=1 Tax=Streptomyces sp. CBMA156 TaxID=1930280 RepID=UPI001661DE15|nr:hypothetical protein [Streptomyces sp. CBMA156]MBD0670934.1 hypothetical protein [Streptomyces sp. CBMA156]